MNITLLKWLVSMCYILSILLYERQSKKKNRGEGSQTLAKKYGLSLVYPEKENKLFVCVPEEQKTYDPLCEIHLRPPGLISHQNLSLKNERGVKAQKERRWDRLDKVAQNRLVRHEVVLTMSA